MDDRREIIPITEDDQGEYFKDPMDVYDLRDLEKWERNEKRKKRLKNKYKLK